MTLEMSQFHEAFFEEGFESLDQMEAALLKLDPSAPNAETINSVFRVAHSLKGGSGMFGFTEITSFTHTLETLLDELRSNRRPVTAPIVDMLLKSTDVLRGMLQATKAKAPIDQQVMADLQFDLEQLVARPAAPAAPTASPAPVAAATPAPAPAAAAPPAAPAAAPVPAPGAGTADDGPGRRWRIEFRPNERLLALGNDPLRMLGELAELGTLEVNVSDAELPAFADMDPEVCYLQWTLSLRTEVDAEVIHSVFEWAEGDCELKISPLDQAPVAAAPPAAAPSASPAAPAHVRSDTAPAPAPATANAPAAAAQAASAPANADSNSIRVSIEKIDDLMNTVGEIVITQSMLMQHASDQSQVDHEQLRNGLSQLERNVRELQETVMRVRMLPISFVFSRFPRMVRDLAQKLGKQIELKLTGEQTELDKTVLEKIGDPLVHLVRNSVDHGIEGPEARVAAGKPALGTVHLDASHRGGNIAIVVSDDGKGLDRERILAKARERNLVGPGETLTEEQVYELLFMPGFSTAEKTTDVSGRGVGMDVVRRNIKSLGGKIDIISNPGKGSSFVITLPLTLAIVDGQSVAVGGQTYIVPLISIVESLQLKPGQAKRLAEGGELVPFRDEYLPVVRVHELFGVEPRARELHDGLVVIAEGDGRRFGLFVDDLLGQQQVVIKSLESNYGRVEGVSGATILGDGSVALILDLAGLLRGRAQLAAA